MTGVIVRRANAADWSLVREVRLRALADAPQAFGSTLAREQAFDDATWQHRVAPGNWVLAVADGDTIGVAAGVAAGVGADADAANAAERQLVAMWVAPQWRGRRVADAVVAAVTQWAMEMGATTLSLWVADGNVAARRFYLRLGFIATGERQPLPSDPTVGEECMRLALAPLTDASAR